MGRQPTLVARTDDGRRAQVTLDTRVEPARKTPLDAEAVRDKLGRLGDTPYAMGTLCVSLPDRSTFAISSLNRARRQAVKDLAAAARRSVPTTSVTARSLIEGGRSYAPPRRACSSSAVRSSRPRRRSKVAPTACIWTLTMRRTSRPR
jgi:putative protease